MHAISRACFFQLRQLRSIRRAVDTGTASSLVHTFVSSRLDYCNSLLASTPKVVPDVLQNLQNAATRLLTGYSRRQHGIYKLVCEKPHWLSIHDRMKFKLCLLVYKSLHSLAPGYKSELCVPVSNNEHRTRLRSAQHRDLIAQRVKLTKYGQRAFAGPSAWNCLPTQLKDYNLSLKVFKSGLETHFFS